MYSRAQASKPLLKCWSALVTTPRHRHRRSLRGRPLMAACGRRPRRKRDRCPTVSAAQPRHSRRYDTTTHFRAQIDPIFVPRIYLTSDLDELDLRFSPLLFDLTFLSCTNSRNPHARHRSGHCRRVFAVRRSDSRGVRRTVAADRSDSAAASAATARARTVLCVLVAAAAAGAGRSATGAAVAAVAGRDDCRAGRLQAAIRGPDGCVLWLSDDYDRR